MTSWIVRPALAEALSKLKTASGSNQPLIEFEEDGITVAGLPVLVSDQVDADTVAWGVPSEHVKLVLRAGTKVEKFRTCSATASGFAPCRVWALRS